MGKIGVTEILLIIVIILLLFGARRIPDLMRALGSGVREFRKGVRGEEEEPKKEEKNKNLPSDQT